MSSIADNLQQIKATLREGVALCAVSKYHPEEQLAQAYDAGQRIFGESHVQELVRKHEALCPDIEWHFIGHLQTNKVKYIAPFVSLIHSGDSPRLIAEVNKQGIRCSRRIPILLQLHIAQEESKYGFTVSECRQWLQGVLANPSDWTGISIRGVMAMATNCADPQQWRREFREAKAFYDGLKSQAELCTPSILSMGMSHDYQIAMEEGATLVRIGTAIFGER